MRKSLLIIFALFVVLPVIAAPIPHDARKPTYYFPVEVGTKWVYVVNDNREEIRVITNVEEKEGAKIVTVSRIGKDNNPRPLQVVSVTEKGLVLLKEFEQELNPPAVWLKLPCKVGDQWKCDSNWFGFPTKIRAEAEVRKMAELEVLAGKFHTIEVRRDYALNSDCGGYYRIDWFAPGVGPVQTLDYWDGAGSLAVLKSFTPVKR